MLGTERCTKDTAASHIGHIGAVPSVAKTLSLTLIAPLGGGGRTRLRIPRGCLGIPCGCLEFRISHFEFVSL